MGLTRYRVRLRELVTIVQLVGTVRHDNGLLNEHIGQDQWLIKIEYPVCVENGWTQPTHLNVVINHKTQKCLDVRGEWTV
jgi:hypothetical protein